MTDVEKTTEPRNPSSAGVPAEPKTAKMHPGLGFRIRYSDRALDPQLTAAFNV